MVKRAVAALALAAATGLAVAAVPAVRASSPSVVVHEWGTFTSIADDQGQAQPWYPLGGPQDLPCFVERFRVECIKCMLVGAVRMETPVLYFYATAPTSMRVSVDFKRGAITEWYPHAAVTPEAVSPAMFARDSFTSRASWADVKIEPGAREDFAQDPATRSHYFVARETDASPIEVDGQREKFLFYRGIGAFQPPLTAIAAADGSVELRSRGAWPVGDAIYFERRGDAVSYAIRRGDGLVVRFEPLSIEGHAEPPTAELERLLVAHGLYEKEAKAMIGTWRDSWFTEGARVFYLAPREMVDATLPLDLQPAPASLERAFVGRIELFTPATARDLTRAIAANDRATLLAYGRVLEPMVQRLLANASADEHRRVQTQLAPIYTEIVTGAAPSRF